jgi:hypothetical protein
MSMGGQEPVHRERYQVEQNGDNWSAQAPGDDESQNTEAEQKERLFYLSELEQRKGGHH